MICLLLISNFLVSAVQTNKTENASNITTLSDNDVFYSTTSDSGITQTSSTYDNAWESEMGIYNDERLNFSIGHTAFIFPSPSSVKIFQVERSMIFFDTSNLPDDASIISATLSLYGNAKIIVDEEINLIVQNGYDPYPHEPVIAEDFGDSHYYGNCGSISSNDFITTGYNEITLNSEGISEINKQGTSKYCLRIDKEINKESPWDGTGYGFYQEFFNVYSSDMGGSYRPKLTVEYTTGGGDLNVQTNDATNIDENSAKLNGKIIDYAGENCQIRFRYKKQSETNWNYPSDWHGSYNTGDTFNEIIINLESECDYDYQAGAKNTQDTVWGNTKSFTTQSTGNINDLPIWGVGNYWIYDFNFDFSYSALDIDGSINNMKLLVESIDETNDEYLLKITGDISAYLSILDIIPGGSYTGDVNGYAHVDRSTLALKNVYFESQGQYTVIETLTEFSMTFDPPFDFFDFPIEPSEDESNPWDAETYADINGLFKVGIIQYPFQIDGDFEGEQLHFVTQEDHTVNGMTFNCAQFSGSLGPQYGGMSKIWYSDEVGYIVDLQEAIFGWEGVDATLDMPLKSTNYDASNNPPNPPSKPIGETNLIAGNEYSYTTSATDPEDDYIYYKFDWGIGEESEWLGPYSSGQSISKTHKWYNTGSFNVRVKAKDENDIESQWSQPLSINVASSMPTTNIKIHQITNDNMDDIDYNYPWDLEGYKPEWYYKIDVITNIDQSNEKSSTTSYICNKDSNGNWRSKTTWTPDNQHELLSYGPEVTIKIKVMDHDEWWEIGDDLSDVSGCNDDGVDNDVADIRGAIYHGTYNLVTNTLNPDGYSTNPYDYSDYYSTEGEWININGEQKPDKSNNYDGNDIKVLFSISDSYKPPKAEIEPITDDIRLNQEVQFIGKVTEGISTPEKPYQWHWNFDDGTTANTQNPKHTFSSEGQYDIELTVTDAYGQTDTDVLTITVGANLPPAKPSTPIGPVKGNIKETHTFQSSTTDPDGDMLLYMFDWGDGTNSGWVGTFPSGTAVQSSHKWNKRGTYHVKVKAKDEYGDESPWSNPTPIQTAKNKPFTFLQNQPLFKIIKQLFSLLQF